MFKHKLISKRSILENEKKTKSKKNEEEENEYEEEKENNEVTCSDNHIYFYGDVNTKNILLLIKYIKDVNNTLFTLKSEVENKFESSVNLYIYLHINSCGGYIMDAFAAINYIKNSKIPIISIVDGYAASAATFLSIVSHKRQITAYSSMLIHQLSSGVSGTFQQLDDDHINNIYLQNKIKKLYVEHSYGKLTNKLLDKILKHDIMWDPQKCKKYGIIDEII